MRFILFLFLFFFSVSIQASEVYDDQGQRLNLSKPAQRIISLAPDITEILFEIGAGSSIIGVISGSDYPSEALKIPVVGSYNGIDIEKIISLKPDLIVIWSNTFARQLKALKKFAIPIYTTNPRSLEDIPRSMTNLGILTGREQAGKKAADHFLERLKALRQQYQAEKPIRVFYQIGSYSLMTINKDSWINQVIGLCGGQNLFANSRSIAPEISWESLLVANPDVILSGASNSDWEKPFERWPDISAVKKHLLFSINPDWMNRAGPRLLDAVEIVCQRLHKARVNTHSPL